MTAKEKAVELVENFMLNVLDYEGCSINFHKAKQCALIAVDLLQEQLFLTNGKYWADVKKQIEKL